MRFIRPALLLLPFLGGCASALPLAPEFCVVQEAPEVSPDTVRVAADRPDLLGGLYYEPILRRRCDGSVAPQLLASWDDDTYRLRDGASFWDGTPVTDADIARAANTSGTPVTDGVIAGAVNSNGTPAGPHTLPEALAGRLVVREDGQGTTAVRPAADGTYNTGNLILQPVTADDLRDLLPNAVDVLVTTNPDVIAFGKSLSEFEAAPLPYRWTYVYQGPTRDEPIPAELRSTLARDAVRAEARPAPSDHCFASSQSPAATVGYDPTDQTARELAERIVALSGVDPEETARDSAATRAHDTFALAVTPRAVPGRGDAQILRHETSGLACDAGLPLIETRPFVVYRRGWVGIGHDGDGHLRLDGGRP